MKDPAAFVGKWDASLDKWLTVLVDDPDMELVEPANSDADAVYESYLSGHYQLG